MSFRKCLERKSAVVLVLFLSSVSLSAAGEPPNCSYETGDNCRFSVERAVEEPVRVKLSDSRKMKIEIARESTSASTLNAAHWGVPEPDYAGTVSLLTKLVIKVDGEKLRIPASAVSGIANPKEIQITSVPEWYNVNIHGGDASTSYVATLHFIGDQLVWRQVQHGEFPEVAWETTTYSSF